MTIIDPVTDMLTKNRNTNTTKQTLNKYYLLTVYKLNI